MEVGSSPDVPTRSTYLLQFFFFSVVEESRRMMEVGSSPVELARSTYLIFLLNAGEEGRSIVEVGTSPDVLAESSPECHPANQAGRLLLSTPKNENTQIGFPSFSPVRNIKFSLHLASSAFQIWITNENLMSPSL